MLSINERYLNVLAATAAALPCLDRLDGSVIAVTGATGMIGSCIVDTLMAANKAGHSIRVCACSRSTAKLRERFSHWCDDDLLTLSEYHAEDDIRLDVSPDHIIHCASNAAPAEFAAHPVETLLSNVSGLDRILRFARDRKVRRTLYVSSGEYYGEVDENNSDFTEDYCGYINCADPRSCYPEGKRAGEVLCHSYIAEYGADIVIARPCHSFGPTMTDTDSRAVSQFIRNAVSGKNIVMKSDGLMERSQCYTADVAGAILFLLVNGVCGEAYNIADPRYQMTIRQFAETAAAAAGKKVIFECPDETEKKGYSKRKRAVLSSDKLKALGWSPVERELPAIEETYLILKDNEKEEINGSTIR